MAVVAITTRLIFDSVNEYFDSFVNLFMCNFSLSTKNVSYNNICIIVSFHGRSPALLLFTLIFVRSGNRCCHFMNFLLQSRIYLINTRISPPQPKNNTLQRTCDHTRLGDNFIPFNTPQFLSPHNYKQAVKVFMHVVIRVSIYLQQSMCEG